MKRIIHVDQFALNPETHIFTIDKRPFVVLNIKGRVLARGTRIKIDGPSRVIFRKTDHPVYGARAWIETESKVTVK